MGNWSTTRQTNQNLFLRSLNSKINPQATIFAEVRNAQNCCVHAIAYPASKSKQNTRAIRAFLEQKWAEWNVPLEDGKGVQVAIEQDVNSPNWT